MLDARILTRIDRWVDGDDFLQSAAHIAEKAQQGVENTQMRNLQNIVNSTTRFSEILNFVKAQTGRHKKWRELGPKIISELQKIDLKAKEFGADEEQRGEIRLRLCRHWVKIVVAEYSYRNASTRGGKR